MDTKKFSQIRVQTWMMRYDVEIKETMQCLKCKSHLLFVLELIHLKLNPLCTVQFFPQLHLFLFNLHYRLTVFLRTHTVTHTYTLNSQLHHLRLIQVILKGNSIASAL